MGATKVGGAGLDKAGTRRAKRERCGPDGGGRGLRRVWRADHEGEGVRHGQFSSQEDPYTVGRDESKYGAESRKNETYCCRHAWDRLYGPRRN
eukprot:1177651-Heterocapsa_arctica.AAC.1